MEQNDKIKEIYDGILEINNSVNDRVNICSDKRINLDLNLESLQASYLEIKNYIEVLKKKIQDEENFFFVGIGSQENIAKLEEQELLEKEIKNSIESLNESIECEKERIDFLNNVSGSLIKYCMKLNSLIDNSCEKEIECKENINDNIKEEIKSENTNTTSVENSVICITASKRDALISDLKLCHRLSKIDYERCYIELEKIIKGVEKWEKE